MYKVGLKLFFFLMTGSYSHIGDTLSLVVRYYVGSGIGVGRPSKRGPRHIIRGISIPNYPRQFKSLRDIS
jgi:hypothetical protein